MDYFAFITAVGIYMRTNDLFVAGDQFACCNTISWECNASISTLLFYRSVRAAVPASLPTLDLTAYSGDLTDRLHNLK